MSEHSPNVIQSVRPRSSIGWLIGAGLAALFGLMAALVIIVDIGDGTMTGRIRPTPDPESTPSSVRLALFIVDTVTWMQCALLVIWMTAAFCLYRLSISRMPIVAMTVFGWLVIALASAMPLAMWHLMENSPIVLSPMSHTSFTRGDLISSLEPALMLFAFSVSPFVVGFVSRLIERLLRILLRSRDVAPVSGQATG